MPEDDSLVTLETAHSESADPDPRDDWLGATPEIEWFPDGGEATRQGPRRRGGRPARSREPGAEYVLDPELRRRRLVAAAVVVVLVVAVVVFALVAFGGGSGKPLTPTTPVVTTPATTTPAQTTPATTTVTHHAVTSLKLVLPASGKLSLNDTGSAVKTLQKALVKLGSGALTADGNFGSLTERAVVAFQQAHGLTADGVVGAKTAQAINAALAAA